MMFEHCIANQLNVIEQCSILVYLVYFFYCLDAHLFDDVNGNDDGCINDNGGSGREEEGEKHDLYRTTSSQT